MKKFFPAASVLTIGAAGLALSTVAQAQSAGGKPWTLRAGVTGFYNDNVYTRSDRPKVDSFGFEVNPGFTLSLPVNDGQTQLSFSYDYILRYFENREKHIDHNHLVNARLSHNFNSRYKIDVFDNFAQAQEPQQLAAGGTGGPGLLLRAEGTNFRNIAGFDFTAQLNERWSGVVGYRHSIYRFDNADFARSLDRTEHLPSANLRYQLTPTTLVGVLYQYGITDYDGPAGNVGVVRDVNSHFIAATIDKDFTPNLKGALRAGIQINDFENIVGAASRDGISPYVDGSLTYSFAKASSLSLGVRHQLTATDVSVLGVNNGGPASDPIRGSSATTGRLSLSHFFTPKFGAMLGGVYQHGTFIGGGPIDGVSDSYASVDLNLTYKFTQNIAARVGYAHDRVDSDIVGDLREYSRNRVFLGVNFTY